MNTEYYRKVKHSDPACFIVFEFIYRGRSRCFQMIHVLVVRILQIVFMIILRASQYFIVYFGYQFFFSYEAHTQLLGLQSPVSLQVIGCPRKNSKYSTN